jgi:hypothetical protein
MDKQTVMLCGLGGGMDIMSCLPLYYEMKNDYNIILCNLSFTSKYNLDKLSEKGHIKKLIDGCYEIVKGVYADHIDYFPEYKLANVLNCPIYAMTNYNTVKEICDFYDAVLNNYNEINAAYMCDGGCDGILHGSETELGTPVEDYMHIKAIILNNKIKNKYVCALGMNADCGHGVIESELLSRLNFIRENGIILSEEILDLSPNISGTAVTNEYEAVQIDKKDKSHKVKFYYDTVLKCTPKHSIVHSFVLCALEGNYGQIIPKYAKSRMTVNRDVIVSDLTKTFIICDADKLYNNNLFMPSLDIHMTSDEFDKLLSNRTITITVFSIPKYLSPIWAGLAYSN